MKRTLVIVFATALLLGLSSGAALAQGIGDVVVKAGFTLSKLSGEPDEASRLADVEFDQRAGFAAGVGVIGHFSRRFAVEADLMFLSRRTETPTNTLESNHIHVPVVLKYYFSDEPTSPNIFLGPSASYRIDTSAEGDRGGLIDPVDIDDEVKRSSIEIVVGAGVDIDTHFQIEARYIFGVEDYFDDAKNVDYKWRQFLFTAGYIF